MGSNASREGHQTNDGSFGDSNPELFQTHNAATTSPNQDFKPRKEKAQNRPNNNNNNNYISKKAPDKNKEATLDSDMHFIVDTFESVEKMTSKEQNKRRRWGRNKDKEKEKEKEKGKEKEKEKEKEDTKNKPAESTSAPSRLTDSDNTNAKGILAKGKHFLLRRQPVVKHPSTAPSTSNTASNEKEESEDEWEYQKVVIDGFDPEKFKQANAAKKPIDISRSIDDQSLSTLRPNGDPLVLRIRCAEIQERAVPSTFDFTDEQLMSSIEKEFK